MTRSKRELVLVADSWSAFGICCGAMWGVARDGNKRAYDGEDFGSFTPFAI